MTNKQFFAALEKLGYRLRRHSKGSHQIWAHSSGATITVSANIDKSGKGGGAARALKQAERAIRLVRVLA